MLNTQYGSWAVLHPAARGDKVLCRCVCGIEKSINRYSLIKGTSSSCGCAGKRGHITHGLSKDSAYSPWKAMKGRCYDPKHKTYADYGGRGITVCDKWRNDFAAFLADMGPRPSPKHSIERDDCNGNYAPDNCRWATQKEQTRNTRKSKMITIDGDTKTVAEWVEITGIPCDRVYKRLKAGKTGRDALFAEPWSPGSRVSR